MRDLDGDGTADYTFVVDGVASVVSGRGRAILWQSAWMGRDAGIHDSLLLADIDEDGRLELMINTGAVGVDIYEIAQSMEGA